MFYITGDTHRDFGRIEDFCARINPAPEDVMIILGDAGINYYGGWRDKDLKRRLAALPLTLFSIHGNHEQRPGKIPSYHTALWNGGEVYVEDEFPNLLFAADGSFFSFDGVQTFVMGGAYSVDKDIRLARNWGWWPDEQPDDEARQWAEQQLEANGWQTDIVLTHTTPLRYEPVEVFMSCVDQSRVDKSTEEWLDTIEQRLAYRRWYCGHYHTEKTIDSDMLFETMKFEPRDVNRIQPFCDRLAKAWEKLPDWRFGQLMVNLMRDYEAEHGHDIFYLEEDEMIQIIEDYCERISGGNAT